MPECAPHKTPSLLVQWDPVQDAWLTAVVLSLQHSVLRCRQPEGTNDVLLRLVVQRRSEQDSAEKSSSYFLRSHLQDTLSPRKSTMQSILTTNSGSNSTTSELVLAVDQPVKRVSLQPVLSCACGRWLTSRKNRKGLCTTAILLTFGTLFFVDPGYQYFNVSHEGQTVAVYLSHPSTMLTMALLIAAIIFIELHFMSAELLWRFTLRSFDTWIIFINILSLEAAAQYERFSTAPANELNAIRYFAEFSKSASLSGLIFTVANLDAVRVSRRWKIFFHVFAILVYVYIYVHSVYIRSWSSIKFCLIGHCATTEGIYAAAALNLLLYLCKHMLRYLSGNRFATLFSPYTTCDTRIHEIIQPFDLPTLQMARIGDAHDESTGHESSYSAVREPAVELLQKAHQLDASPLGNDFSIPIGMRFSL